VLGALAHTQYEAHSFRRHVAEATADDARHLQIVGQHLVVGYNVAGDVHELARRGFIAGIFVTRRNAQGKTADALRAEIEALQALRRSAGLAPLIIATDQEGGPVSRLSPPLALQPPIATLVTPQSAADQMEQRAKAYGADQGRALAALGVNVNFSPVVDLKPDSPSGRLDFHTRINDRAIAADPMLVTRVAAAYARGLDSQGVAPTLKHFPGLGSVAEDTHHFSAHLRLSLDVLNARDWVPFRETLRSIPALLMVGHVVVDDVDHEFPASLSRKLLNGIVRGQWKHDGILISDDMTMAAVYDRGLCESSVQALNAGIDLLLVAYDWEKVYLTLDCLQRAHARGRLTELESSRERLRRVAWRAR
jgi:beta-N-acetylhexosaminidase